MSVLQRLSGILDYYDEHYHGALIISSVIPNLLIMCKHLSYIDFYEVSFISYLITSLLQRSWLNIVCICCVNYLAISVERARETKSKLSQGRLSKACESIIVSFIFPHDSIIIASGLIVFEVSGHLARKGRVQILLEDPTWSAIRAGMARTEIIAPEQIATDSLQELEFENLWIKFDGPAGDINEIITDLKSDAKQFLEIALVSFVLSSQPGRHHRNCNRFSRR